MSATQGRFSERAMWRVMLEVADQINADTDRARLLHFTNNAVYALPVEGIVIRITRSQGLRARVDKVVALARWLEEVDGPANRLACGIEQPVHAGELLATVWEYLPDDGPTPTVTDLGCALRAFHGLGKPPFRFRPGTRWAMRAAALPTQRTCPTPTASSCSTGASA